MDTVLRLGVRPSCGVEIVLGSALFVDFGERTGILEDEIEGRPTLPTPDVRGGCSCIAEQLVKTATEKKAARQMATHGIEPCFKETQDGSKSRAEIARRRGLEGWESQN